MRQARVDRAEATQRFWNSAIRVPECPYPPSPEADHPISNDTDHWYRQSGPDKFKRAEEEIGVSGDSSEALGSSRSKAYPMAAIPPIFMDKTYADARAGTEFEVARSIRSKRD